MASFQLFRDDFQRSGSGWGSSPAPILRTWAGTTQQTTDGEYGILVASSSAPTPETSVDLTALHLADDGEVIITAGLSATGAGYAYLQLHDDDSSHNIALILGFSASSFPSSLTLFNYINADSATAGAGLSLNTLYTFKLDVSRTRGTVRGRIWQATSSEPATWDVEADLEADFFYTGLYVGESTNSLCDTQAGTLKFQDTFSRTIGSGTSLGSADGTGEAWHFLLTSNGTVTVGGGAATATLTGAAGAGYIQHDLTISAPPAGPVEIYCSFTLNTGKPYLYLIVSNAALTSATSAVGWAFGYFTGNGEIQLYGTTAVGVVNYDIPVGTPYKFRGFWDGQRIAAKVWAASASEPASCNVSVFPAQPTFTVNTLTVAQQDQSFPDGGGSSVVIDEIAIRTYTMPTFTAAWDYIEIADQEPSEDTNDSIVDLTNTVCYNGYCFGFTFPAGGGPGQGSYIKRIDITEVETVGYDDKRALQDGKDAADVFLGERRIGINAAVYGSTRGAAFDELALLSKAFHPVDAFEEDTTNLGFLPLDFYRPTADIVTWPLSAYPSGIPLRAYARPLRPVSYAFIRERTGGVDEKGLAMEATANLWARDPRFYLQTSQPVAISASTTTLTYRGDYESWPIVSFTMTAAGNSACQIVIAGGTVKIDLSGTTTGSYQIVYADRLIKKVSDGSLYNSIINTSFAQDWRVVRSGSTARVSSITGMSAITVDYREAFV